MISSYEGAADKELRRDLEAKLRPHISFLTECRPMSVSMRNAIKFLKLTISNLDPSLTEEDVCDALAVYFYFLHNHTFYVYARRTCACMYIMYFYECI